MRIYKFYPAEYGLQSLEKLRLKVSTIESLNDPFELLSVDIGRLDIRTRAVQFREKIASTHGVVSFSTKWNEPLMWAHYARNHKGLAIGFDVSEHHLLPIKYVRRREKSAVVGHLNDDQFYDLMKNALTQKHVTWRYEAEMRMMHPLHQCDREHGDKFFSAFADLGLTVKEVIFGAGYEPMGKDRLQGAYEKSGVLFSTVRAKFTGFKMCKQSNKKLVKTL